MNDHTQSVAAARDPGEMPLRLHSRVTGPIAALTFPQRSLLMAELSMIAYNDPDEARRAFAWIGFPDMTFFDRDGSQAYRVRNDRDCVIACRGTEPNEWNDIRADANAASVLAETAGRVHRGFKREVDDLWPMLETALAGNEQPLWFCGHSLGAAMATICASRCHLSHIDSNPRELYTFGSPRVGNQRYIGFVALKHHRYVNNNDLVTRVPPAWLGYRHSGVEIYLDHRGNVRNFGEQRKRRDRFLGFLKSLRRWKIDQFSDHSIHRYIDAILRAVERDVRQTGCNQSPSPQNGRTTDHGNRSSTNLLRVDQDESNFLPNPQKTGLFREGVPPGAAHPCNGAGPPSHRASPDPSKPASPDPSKPASPDPSKPHRSS